MHACILRILRSPGAANREDAIFSGDAIFLGESLYQEQESPWEITLTELLSEAFKFLQVDWPKK